MWQGTIGRSIVSSSKEKGITSLSPSCSSNLEKSIVLFRMQVDSALRSIKGVGEKTEQRLIMHFGSVQRIAAASIDDIAALVGRQLAERIHNELNGNHEE